MMKLQYTDQLLKIIEPLLAQIITDLRVSFPKERIEHVGSTAIKGSVTKGDIDIVLVVKKRCFTSSIKLLKNLGYTIKKDTLRTSELCMFITRQYNYDVAIQLIVEGSEFEYFMLFRDSLLKNKALVEQYNDVKSQSDDKNYRENKAIFETSETSLYRNFLVP